MNTFTRIALAVVLLATFVPKSHASITDFIDFESDTGTFTNFGGVLTRVASGTNGVTSKSGSYHGEIAMTESSGSGAYTFHTNTPPQIKLPPGATSFTQSVDVFFDIDATGASLGDQWILENSIEDAAQNWTEGSQFNVEKTATGWQITQASIDVNSDGWYTFASVWSDTGVGWDRTAKIYNGAGTEIYSSGSAPNQVSYADAQYVGYTWLLNDGTLDDGFTLAIDNANLDVEAVPEPSTYIVFTGLILCFGLASWWRKRRQQAA